MQLDMIRFRLMKANIDQFATLVNRVEDIDSLEISISSSAMVSFSAGTIAMRMRFDVMQQEVKCIVLELTCTFAVENMTSFRKVDDLVIPKDFLAHLAMHTVGTARGVLVCKLEGTQLSQFVLPTVDVTKSITDDLVIKGVFKNVEKASE